MFQSKSLPMTGQEVNLLLDLVEANKVVYSKCTDATNNRLKDEAWRRITGTFNASVDSGSRTPAKLRMKWENLKKSARKRAAENIRSGVLYMPSGDVLDRVASILSGTRSIIRGNNGPPADSKLKMELTEETDMLEPLDLGDSEDSLMARTSDISGIGSLDSSTDYIKLERNYIAEDCLERVDEEKSCTTANITLIEEDIRSRIKRNTAIAEYYTLKKKKLEFEMKVLEKNNKLNPS